MLPIDSDGNLNLLPSLPNRDDLVVVVVERIEVDDLEGSKRINALSDSSSDP